MRRIIFILILIFGIIGSFSVFAHGVEEEAKGKAILEKLETKEISCENLTDDDFEALGEYFMGQMTDDSHEAMNNMMEQMMGKEGEEQMHIAMGKRMSNCQPDAPMPQNMMSGGMMGMMPMTGMMGENNYFWLNIITYILSWIFLIVAIIALLYWIFKKKV